MIWTTMVTQVVRAPKVLRALSSSSKIYMSVCLIVSYLSVCQLPQSSQAKVTKSTSFLMPRVLNTLRGNVNDLVSLACGNALPFALNKATCSK